MYDGRGPTRPLVQRRGRLVLDPTDGGVGVRRGIWNFGISGNFTVPSPFCFVCLGKNRVVSLCQSSTLNWYQTDEDTISTCNGTTRNSTSVIDL